MTEYEPDQDDAELERVAALRSASIGTATVASSVIQVSLSDCYSSVIIYNNFNFTYILSKLTVCAELLRRSQVSSGLGVRW